MRRACAAVAAALLVTSNPPALLADATAFLGSHPGPEGGSLRGAALGISLRVLGLEFEYADTVRAGDAEAPSLRSGMVNLLLETPRRPPRPQIYASVGGGVYRERGAATAGAGFARSAGGGIKIPLPGPLRLRVDYRVFSLRGSARGGLPQRIYAGVNLAF